MNDYSFGHLSNDVAWNSYIAAESHEIAGTAKTLALLAEVDERKLYLPAGYASMCDFCVRKRSMTEDMAWLRIRVARTARQFPAIFPALADCQLNLTSVLLLAPRLSAENAAELLSAAAGQSKDELKLLLAERFPRPDLPTSVEPLTMSNEIVPAPPTQLGLDPVGTLASSESSTPADPLSLRARIDPRSAGRFALQCTLDQEAHDLLEYVQALLGHSVPSGDVAKVLKRSLQALAAKLEQQKFGKCSRSGKARGSKNPRYIPVAVKRAVWKRDGGRCAFIGTGGKRCDARAPIEFDHIDSVGRGGDATEFTVRLLCRAHNQFAAEQTYGADFMKGKREQGKVRAAAAKAKREAKEAEKAAADAAQAKADEIIPWLQELGCNLQRARRGVEYTMHMLDAPIEERMKAALRGLAPRCTIIKPNGERVPG